MRTEVRGFAVALTSAALLLAGGAESRADDVPRKPPKTRRVESASPKVFKRLMAAHEALAAENYAEANQQLEAIQAMGKLSPYEQSLMHQSFGYLYASQERYPQALTAFEKCVAAGGLPEEQALDIRYNLGQLYLASEQYDKGIQTLESWMADSQNPGPAAYFLLANAYVQREDYDRALSWAEQGLAQVTTPRESWLQLGLALYYEKKRYAECAELLEQLVENFPKKDYWKQLSAIYAELGQDTASLGAFELAYRQGLLTSGSELVQLAQLLRYHDLPFKAAMVLQRGLESGDIEKTAGNLELLANSWIHAREYERAEDPLMQAAALSDEGKLYLRLGEIYIEGERWQDARKALRSALKKGELDEEGHAHLLLGIALYHADSPTDSKQAFQAASRHEAQRRSAHQWLVHVERGTN